MSPLEFGLPVLLLTVHFAVVTQAFVRYTLVKEEWPQWQSDDKCRTKGYDGLAVIDTANKWAMAKLLLESQSVPADQGVWIGVEYDMGSGEPSWRDGRPCKWGAWATGQPDWSTTTVLISMDTGSGQFVWKTMDTNYPNWILCSKENDKLTMARHSNLNVNLGSATALTSQTTTTVEDCGMQCGSATGCDYFAYKAADGTCKLYGGSALSSVLNVDSGTPSALHLYLVN
ncbi:uncharacterized protein LOC143283782 [Babylonia areolata]|uniref:uncharacterized protein LOC143283782 n=1 Tax=Babylonia areolata TaxID=304850 RepID=UPI003FCF33A4